jgi:hypothetical protein
MPTSPTRGHARALKPRRPTACEAHAARVHRQGLRGGAEGISALQCIARCGGENLVFKRYFHIGFAADTPNGLVVPVIRDADR